MPAIWLSDCLFACLRVPEFPALWLLLSALFRARYSLLTLALPVVLAVVAIRVWPRGTLYSLLLPRTYRKHEVSRSRALSDLFWTSFTACCVASLAGAGVMTAAIHGPCRAPSFTDPSPACGHGRIPDDAILPWGPWWFAAALVAPAALPVASLVIWLWERSPPAKPPQSERHRSRQDLSDALLRVAGGGLAAGAVVLLIGAVHRALFGPSDRILPLRPPFPLEHLAGGRIAEFGQNLLSAVGAGFAGMGCRQGYLDESGRLLASQAELILCVVAGGLVYAAALAAIARSDQPAVRFCTAVYLLVCIGSAGVVFAGVAYFFDRFTISAPLIVGFWTFCIAVLAKTDHFFELRPRHGPALAGTDAANAHQLPALEASFRSRLDRVPADENGMRTAVIATASGGGIQASAWSAEVLTGLAESLPRFKDSLCVASGVSGGSVGAGCFLAGTYAAAPAAAARPKWQDIRDRARASLLEQVAWGVAFADLPRLFAGWIPGDKLVDRGWAIERLLEKRLDYSAGPAARRSHFKTLGDLVPAVKHGTMPVPLFNATCVQTGQRVIMSPVVFFPRDSENTRAGITPYEVETPQPPPAGGGAINRVARLPGGPPAGARSLHIPEDYSKGSFTADPTIATAVRLSATFSYASPVARPTRGDEAAWKSANGLTSATPKARFDLHICDGGYADNTGVVAAVEASHHLLQALRDRIGKEPAEKDAWRILFVRIEPFPPRDATKPDSGDGFSQVLLGPAFGLLASRVATQQDRANRELDQFNAAATDPACCIPVTTVMFQFREKNAATGQLETPPLSWALSPRQQYAIEGAWTKLTTQSDYLTCHAALA